METEKETFVFEKMNFIIMVVGLAFIILGFILMSGGGSGDPNVFNEEEIFSPTRITVAPVIILLGFIIEIVAIVYKPKNQAAPSSSNSDI